MTEDAKLKLNLRLVPADGTPADPTLLDDLIRLIRQGVVTSPPAVTQANTGGQFRKPPVDDNSQNDLEAKVRHDIEQASEASQVAVQKRAETAKQPDGEAKLAAEALEAAREVVAAVQRAIIRGVTVSMPDDVKPT
ncbi:MAG: hypothetical protein K8U57_36820 [Planctomycetes bacterium]|nr:hypothetical protein [Planctomycetota bacterium]